VSTALKTPALISLTAKTIEQLAEYPAYFDRGANYYQEGRVGELEEEDGVVSANVIGQECYEVQLWEEDNNIQYECDCPLGKNGEFCKHCVAVGLAWLNACKTNAHVPSPKSKSLSGKEIEQYLCQQDKTKLVQWLMEQVRKDKQFANYLKLQAACNTQQSDQDNKLALTYRETIKKAIDIRERDYIDYRQVRTYQQGIWVVVNGLQDLLDKSDEPQQAQTVVELIEFALQRVEKATLSVDDSNGGMGELMHHLVELHHEACERAEPDPTELAKRLFDWAIKSEWNNFSDAVTLYAEILGASGLATYRQLAEKHWQKMPTIGPGEKVENYHERFVITGIMEDLAKQTGDVEALVSIKSKKLEYAYDFLKIAEVYLEAKNPKKALEWAERGIQAFPHKTDQRLRVFLADLYHRLKRHDETMALIWAEYTETPRLDRYQLLKTHALKVNHTGQAWPSWREKALAFLRTQLTQKGSNLVSNRWYAHDYSELVQIFLWEEDTATALQEAEAGGCSLSLWLQLATALEKSNPEKAIQIYQAQIGPIVSRTNNEAYQQAYEILKKVRNLMEIIGHPKAFRSYLSRVKQQFQVKRNFMKLLTSFDA